jgi:hypothetical protein
MSINHGEAVLTGAVNNRVVGTLGEMLGRLIPGVDEVINETVYDDSALRHPTGKTTKLPILSVQDVQLRDELIFFLDTDQTLGTFGYEIEVVRNGLCIHTTVPDEETGHHLERSLGVLRESGRLSILATVDQDTVFSNRRKFRPDEESLQVMAEFRLRLTSAWPTGGIQLSANSTTLQLKGRVADAEKRMIAEAVAASTYGVTSVDSLLTL